MIPERIAEPDRTWLTVAAYNVGFGHLEDARIITQALGKNPDSWADVREQLPLLAQERWYTRARRGYARGWEPVQFVDRIQRFLTLLEWQPGDGGSVPTTPARCRWVRRPRPPARRTSTLRRCLRRRRRPRLPSRARPHPGPEPARGLYGSRAVHGRPAPCAQVRRRAKNSCSRRMHSSNSTPPNTSTR